MKIIQWVLISILVLTSASAYAYSEGDFQVWNTDTEEVALSKKAKIALEEEFRLGEDASEFYYQHYDVGVSYDAWPFLAIGGGYRHVLEKVKGKFKTENEPYFCFTPSYSLCGFKIDSRSRFEYRHFDYQDDSWRYRNKISVKMPWKYTRLNIQPFVSDEFFTRIDQYPRVNQNRITAGLGMELTKNIKPEIYYMFQSTKSSAKWADINVFGTKLKIIF